MRYHNYVIFSICIHVLIPATIESESSNCDKVHVFIVNLRIYDFCKLSAVEWEISLKDNFCYPCYMCCFTCCTS